MNKIIGYGLLIILGILLVWNIVGKVQTNSYENKCKLEYNNSFAMDLRYCTYDKEYCFCQVRKCEWLPMNKTSAICELKEVIFKLKD